MIVLDSCIEISAKVEIWKQEGKTISFVPTMGYLHEGHLELIRKARSESDILIVSIFVNPAQFNDPEDLEKYPIDIEGDLEKCRTVNADCVFLPSIQEIYPEGIPEVQIRIPHLMDVLCGKVRPGHFEGVLLVLSKMFHIIRPDFLYMGKKDYQQLKIVSYYIKALDFPIKIYGIDTVRERDGLAMSSRNIRLSSSQREAATLIYRVLNMASSLYENGERDLSTFRGILLDVLISNPLIHVEYLEIVDIDTLKTLSRLQKPFLIAIAVYCGNVRLIDNREYF